MKKQVAQIETSPLFIIERSRNANVMHYDALLAKDGRREKLSWVEKKKADGFQARPVGKRL